MNVSSSSPLFKAVYRGDLVTLIAEASGLSRAQASLALKSMIQAIQHGLKEKKKVRISGFGTFRVSNRPLRKGRHPQTGEPLIIPPTSYPIFRSGKMLRGWEDISSATRGQSMQSLGILRVDCSPQTEENTPLRR